MSAVLEGSTQELRVSSEFRNGHSVREFIRRRAEACDMQREAIADLLLAATEVFNNAVEHAHQFRAEQEVSVRVHCDDGVMRVEVKDHGPGIHSRPVVYTPQQVPPTQRGLGLFIASQLVDSLTFHADAGTIVCLAKAVA